MAAKRGHMAILSLFTDPAAWAALATLVVLEIVLGIDNLVFISILSNRLPVDQRRRVRRLGIGLALGLRLALLSTLWIIVGLTAPLIDLGLKGAMDAHGVPSFDTSFSVRDLILIAGGLFLIWKATGEIREHLSGGHGDVKGPAPRASVAGAVVQILVLDLVFSIDSILTAVGMTDDLPIMIAAVVLAVGVMLLASDPLAEFIARNPSVVMLALAFLLMIGAVLIADGFGVHIPKGYIYTAMAFSAAVEGLNIARARRGSKGEH